VAAAWVCRRGAWRIRIPLSSPTRAAIPAYDSSPINDLAFHHLILRGVALEGFMREASSSAMQEIKGFAHKEGRDIPAVKEQPREATQTAGRSPCRCHRAR
jgi:hypothetical protein